MSKRFSLKSDYQPAGDQPQAIEQLVAGLKKGAQYQTLLGVTGSGKTFTVANIIANLNRPTLVIAHNKTLAAQLTQEYRSFFPENAVEYFVSYYDYYQPEAYVPQTDTYIEKEAMINEEIDRLRHAATQSLLNRADVIVVASVSCIYNIGAPELYESVVLELSPGKEIAREALISRLVEMQFIRNQSDLTRGTFSARGNVVDIMPANEEAVYRLVLDGNTISGITVLDAITRRIKSAPTYLRIYPARHYVTDKSRYDGAIAGISAELQEQLKNLRSQNMLLEAERLERRTKYDLEMIAEVGYCNGIENYSRYFDGRQPGDAPHSLLEYFPKDFLTIIDESHVTVSQIGAMYEGDRSRKQTLVEHGFRLPSALDNRPLKFTEFEKQINQVIFTTATPGPYELAHTRVCQEIRDKGLEARNAKNLSHVSNQQSCIVEQIVRPTGLIDPEVLVVPIAGQIDDLTKRIDERSAKGERVLITTLTKRMAEDLSTFLKDKQYKVHYLHSEVDTLDRIETLTSLRKGTYDVLVGVNLLREGLDLPEVSLVAILDADKEGFLRSQTSLIQTIGRAARNVSGQVVLYADTITGSMERAMKETNRRRRLQLEYNKKHGITPQSIQKNIEDITDRLIGVKESKRVRQLIELEKLDKLNIPSVIKQKDKEMRQAAKELDFELAALLRDEIVELKKLA
ncbi:excinuclease ABC subunit UvrB [Candidatus Berkelbacteria bacterium]|nr:excinuclease ABC subunit UvrB [Candidatus Berkelbacteria bacterium]